MNELTVQLGYSYYVVEFPVNKRMQHIKYYINFVNIYDTWTGIA